MNRLYTVCFLFQVCYCAIDTCLNFSQANKLIKDLKPGHLVVAETYTQPPVTLPHKTEFVINWVSYCNRDIYTTSCNTTS